jgi:hypothetical protein
MSSLDWPDEVLSLGSSPGASTFMMIPALGRELENYQLSVGFESRGRYWSGNERLFEIDGRYRCQPESNDKQLSNHEVARCRLAGNKTLVEFNGDSNLTLSPEVNWQWAETRWLSFRGGSLSTPFWKRQDHWQQRSVRPLAGGLDEYDLSLHTAGSANGNMTVDDRTGLDESESAAGESMFLVSESGHYTGSDLSFCNHLSFENLRIACIGFPLDAQSRQYFLQLDEYGNKRQWVSLFHEVEYEKKRESTQLTIVGRVHFKTLSVERLLMHIELTREFPALGNQRSVGALMAYAGLVTIKGQPADKTVYWRLYNLSQQVSIAQSFRGLQPAQCFMERVAEKQWCSLSDECLIQVPAWVFRNDVTDMKPEIKVIDKEVLERPQTPRYLDHYRKLRFEVDASHLVVNQLRNEDIKIINAGVPFKAVQGLPNILKISIEGVPFYMQRKDADRLEYIFMLQRGTLYQGACDQIPIVLQKD